MMYLSIILALTVLAVAVIFAIKNRNDMSKWISCVLLGIFFSTFFMVLPTEWVETGEEVLCKPLYAVISSLFYSFKTLGGRQDLVQLETIGLNKFLKFIYICINYISFALAPILASSLILSFIGDTGEKMRLALRFSGKCYVFSELNENSLALAKGINDNIDKKTIIFCDVKNVDKDLISKAKELGIILLYKPCEDIKISKKFDKYEFCIISSSEDTNIKLAETLILKHSEINDIKVNINAFIQSGTNVNFLESVMESIEKENTSLELRCIDEIAFFCNHLIFNHPLYDTKGNGNNISVAIIGCGRTGMRMLKTVYWAGQIDGYTLKIRVYDKSADKIRKEFERQCPGLKGNTTIKFIEADVDTLDFSKKLLAEENSLDATYIVVAMGDDQLNLSISDELYRIYRRSREFNNEVMPEIFARVRSEVKSDAFFENNDFLENRHIKLFGTAESIFSDKTLFDTDLENLAFAVHLAYNKFLRKKKGDKDYDAAYKNFRTSEYDRRSSMAVALHIPAKLCLCEDIPKTDGNNLTKKNIKILANALKNDRDLCDRLAINEHERWNAFMLSEGYQPVSIEEMFKFGDITGSNRDDLSKLHPCITDWETLDKVESKFNKRYNKDKTFKTYDRRIVESIPAIWRKSQRIKGDN